MPATTLVHCADGTPLEAVWNGDGWEELSFELNGEHWTFPAPAMEIWLDPISPDRVDPAFAEVGLQNPVLVQFVGPFQYYCLREPGPAQMEQMMTSVGALMGRFGSPLGFWREFCEPRARRAVADLEGPLRGGPLEAAAERFGYGMAQTFTSLVPIMGAAMPLRMMLEARFGPEGALLADESTQGGENASQTLDAQLVALAQLGGSTPAVRRILQETEGGARLEALRQERAAGTFVQRFDALIAEHSGRSFGWEVMLPTWGEDPAAVLGMVAAHVRAGTSGGVAASSNSIRDAARERVRAELDGQERGQFEYFLGTLDGLVQIREDRAYWQMRLTGAIRLMLLEHGQRLVDAGRIERAGDIFHLVPAEFEGSAGDLRALVAGRRAEWERASTLTPPPFIGAAPAIVIPPAESADQLRGAPCSRGVVTGRARVVHSPDDVDRFEVGDILVCRMTTPAWTPLFGLAGGVVTETGGPLSHPAITAREYGIPCVLGVEGATTRIADGAEVTVDGAAGIVTLLAPR